MTKAPSFDVAAAHRYFSAYCFNQAWNFIEKKDRTAEDDLLMAALSQASIWHWRQREDCSDRNLAVGYWQASRIQAILDNGTEALRLANVSLSYSGELQPFHLGYAHEAMARAELLVGNAERAAAHLSLARELAARVDDEDDRALLLADLASIVVR